MGVPCVMAWFSRGWAAAYSLVGCLSRMAIDYVSLVRWSRSQWNRTLRPRLRRIGVPMYIIAWFLKGWFEYFKGANYFDWPNSKKIWQSHFPRISHTSRLITQGFCEFGFILGSVVWYSQNQPNIQHMARWYCKQQQSTSFISKARNIKPNHDLVWWYNREFG